MYSRAFKLTLVLALLAFALLAGSSGYTPSTNRPRGTGFLPPLTGNGASVPGGGSSGGDEGGNDGGGNCQLPFTLPCRLN